MLENAAMFVPFTPVWNVTGQPAISLPLHQSGAGLPIGVQLVGAPAAEDVLLSLSAQLEEARPWASRRPELAAA
jgi:amidase